MDCFGKAAQLLASRPHFRAELAAKLRQREFPDDEVAAALDRLEAEGYLDDRKAAAGFVAHRRERGGEGKLRLRAELARRGAAAEAIDEALAGLGEEDDQAAVREAAERWRRLKTGEKTADAEADLSQKDAAALARHLARKGFSPRAIVAVLKTPLEGFEPE